MKKVISFFLFWLCIIGCIVGIGYTIYDGAWPVAIGIAGLSYTAWPKFKEYFVALTL